MYLLTSLNMLASDPVLKKRAGPRRITDRKSIFIIPSAKKVPMQLVTNLAHCRSELL